jgi:hypothetical protein
MSKRLKLCKLSPRIGVIPDEITLEVENVGRFLVSISGLETVGDLLDQLKDSLQKDGVFVMIRGKRELDPESNLVDHLELYGDGNSNTLFVQIGSSNPKWSVYVKGFSQVESEIEKFLPSFKNLLVDAELKFKEVHGVSIPAAGDKPLFMFWRLGELDKSGLLNFLRNKDIVAIIGTSGCGKTRSIYELLCSCYGLFFTCEGDTVPLSGGSDFKYLMDCLEKHIQVGSHEDNFAYLQRFLKSIIVAKLLVFKYLYQNSIKMTPKLWLLIQLKLQSAELVRIVRQYEEEDLQRQLLDLVRFMRNRNIELDPELDMKIPLFMDEAQLTVEKFSSSFVSSHDKNNTRPLYSAMLTVFSSRTESSFTTITSGTGLRLGDCELALSVVDKPDIDIKYLIFNCFSNHSEISAYARDIFPSLNLTEKQSRWFIGRVRFLVNFLRHYAISFNPEVDNLDTFINDYVEDATVFSRESPIGHLFYKSGDLGAKQQHLAESLVILKEYVYHYVIYGEKKKMLVVSKEDKIFEIGLGILSSPNQMNLEVRIDEPLIIKAALNFYVNQEETSARVLRNLFSSKMANETNASSQGFIFESFVALTLLDVYKADCTSLLSETALAKSFVRGQIFQPKGRPLLSQGMDLSQFLREKPSTFLLPRNIVGPDIMFILDVEKKSNGKTAQVLVSVQTKLKDKENLNIALKTVKSENFFKQYVKETKIYSVPDFLKPEADQVEAIIKKDFEFQLGVVIGYPLKWTKAEKQKTLKGTEKVYDASNITDILDTKSLDLIRACLANRI